MLRIAIACVSLVSWATVLQSPETEGCMETAWSTGYLTSALFSFTFDRPGESTCRCCGLCNLASQCVSFSYNSDTRQCQLYGSVASYGTLKPHKEWQYFVMPGRSQHHQFCRQDSDCQTEGDFCRGRVCTSLGAVTCRVIFETFGAGERFGGFIPRMFGFLNGTDIALACMMGPGFHGFTRLLKNRRGLVDLSRRTFKQHNLALDSTIKTHSILSLARHIRLARNDTTYSIKIFRCDQTFVVDFEMPRSEPVLSDMPRLDVGKATVSKGDRCVNFEVSPPYLPSAGANIITVNAGDDAAVEGAIAREDGRISWGPCGVYWMFIYIRE